MNQKIKNTQNFTFTLPVQNYIVPMHRYDYRHSCEIYLKVIIPAIDPRRAMYLTKDEFCKDHWIIDENYKEYQII